MRARLIQQREGLEGTAPVGALARAAIDRERADLDARREGSLTESDAMCATMLEGYGDAERASALARMLFEPRATSTVENAAYSSGIIGARCFGRVLIVSSPVARAGVEVDNHAERALADFRAMRARGICHAHLAAIGCPMEREGQSWSAFE